MAGERDPARKCVLVTPHNSDLVLGGKTRGVSFAVAGDLSVILHGDTDPVVIPGLAAGVIHPLRAKVILATGTTAQQIVAYM